MNLSDIFSRWLHKNERKPPLPRYQAGDIARLMQILEQTDEEELSCEETFQILDHYVEMELHGEEAAGLMPVIKRHLDLCRDCQEEYQALLNILQAQSP